MKTELRGLPRDLPTHAMCVDSMAPRPVRCCTVPYTEHAPRCENGRSQRMMGIGWPSPWQGNVPPSPLPCPWPQRTPLAGLGCVYTASERESSWFRPGSLSRGPRETLNEREHCVRDSGSTALEKTSTQQRAQAHVRSHTYHTRHNSEMTYQGSM